MRARLLPVLLPLALLVLFGVAAAFAFVGEDPGGPQPRRVRGMDLVSYWVGGTVLDAGDAARLYESSRHKPEFKAIYPERPPKYPVGYPPPIYQLFALPQPRFGYVVVAKALLFVMAGLHVAGAALVVAAVGNAAPWRRLILPLAITLPGSISLVMSGQLAGLWILALGGGWWLRARGHRVFAGAALSLLWMKPTLALPVSVACLLLGEWAMIGGMFLGGLGVLGLSCCAGGGPDAWLAYLHRLADPARMIEDFWVLWRRQATLRTFFAGLAPDRAWAYPLGWLGSALGLGMAIVASRFRSSDAATLDLQGGAVLSACLLAGPHLLEYDLGLHLVGMVASFAWIASGRARWPRVGAALWTCAWLAGAFVLVNKAAHLNLTALSVAGWTGWMVAELGSATRAVTERGS